MFFLDVSGEWGYDDFASLMRPTSKRGDLMQIVLNAIQLSDIFFNLEKPKLAAAYTLTADTDEEMEEREQAITNALLEEAESFSRLLDDQVDTDWLVNDYNQRV